MPDQATGARAGASTPHPLAGEAARMMLASGGNAVDAAIAAMLTMSVVIPGSVGPGGYGGSMILRLKDGSVIAMDFDSRAPKAYRPELFASRPESEMFGYLSISVPAVVAGFAEALKRWGTVSWARASEHAIQTASEGFLLDDILKNHMDTMAAGMDETSFEAMFPLGRVPEIGENFVQRDLAGLLQTLADNGPDAFYHGDLPERICAHIQKHGGILSVQDFDYRPEITTPVTSGYRGLQLFTPPLPSSGLSSMQALKVMERFDVSAMETRGADYFHVFAEAVKLCWRDRERYLGDPDFVNVPLEELLSDEWAEEKAGQITEKASTQLSPGAASSSPHTGNVLAADSEGNVISITATLGGMFGSRVVIPGLGMVMGHGMSRFDMKDSSPNRPEVGKRMRHNMSPMIALKDGRPCIALGMPGGETIVTITAQMLMSLVDFGQQPIEAVCPPRVHIESSEPIQACGLSESTQEELRRRGHELLIKEKLGGPCNAMIIDTGTQQITAGSQGLEGSAVGV